MGRLLSLVPKGLSLLPQPPPSHRSSPFRRADFLSSRKGLSFPLSPPFPHRRADHRPPTLSQSRRDFFLSLSPSFLGADLPRPPSRSAGNPYGVERIREGVIGESVPCCPPLDAVAPLWGAWRDGFTSRPQAQPTTASPADPPRRGADRRPTFALPTGGQLTTLRPYYNPTICSRCNREQIVNLLPLRGKRFKGL